jgi:MSHA biogenesis protein MshI
MRFFRKAKKTNDWLAIAFQSEGVFTSAVTRVPAAKPAVTMCAFFPGTPSAESLEKIGKDVHAAQYRCTTLLGAREYQLLSVEAPNVPPDELKTAIRWRLKDMLDYHIDDATIDVLNIPVEANAPVRNTSMFAVSARNSLIQAKQELFSAARFDLDVIDILEMAQRNIAAELEPEGRGLAMLSFTEEGGLLTISYKGELYLSRRIEVSLAQLAEDDFDRRHALFDRITLELQRSLDHFDRQFNYISVAKLMLAPNPAEGLDAYLTSNLYTPIETFALDQVFDFTAVPDLMDREAQQRYFMCLGAALRLEEVKL